MRNKQHLAFGLDAFADYFWHWLFFGAVMTVSAVTSFIALAIGSLIGISGLSLSFRLLVNQFPWGRVLLGYFTNGSFFYVGLFLLLGFFLLVYVASLTVSLYQFASDRLQGKAGWLISYMPKDRVAIVRFMVANFLQGLIILLPAVLTAYFFGSFLSSHLMLLAALSTLYALIIFYVVLRFLFFLPCVVLDQSLSIFNALAKSMELSKKDMRGLWSFFGTILLANGGRSFISAFLLVVVVPFAQISLLRTLEQEEI